MGFRVFPDEAGNRQDRPLAVAAAAATGLKPIGPLSNAGTCFIRVAWLPASGPGPSISLKADTGSETAIPRDGMTHPVFLPPASLGAVPLNAGDTLLEQLPNGIYRLRIFLQVAASWQINFRNDDAIAHTMTWVVADSDDESQQPWIHATLKKTVPADVVFTALAGQTLKEDLEITNAGTGAVTVAGTAPAVAAPYSISGLPVTLGPNAPAAAIVSVGFTPAGPAGGPLTAFTFVTANANDPGPFGLGHNNGFSLLGKVRSGPQLPAPRASGPAVSWGSDQLAVFGIGADSGPWQTSWDGFNWSPWEARGGILVHPVEAVCWGLNRIDLFGIGTDNALWHMAWDGANWSPWESRGGTLVGTPKVVSWGPGRLDVFGIGLDRSLWHMAWDGANWSPWESRGGQLSRRVDAVCWGPNRIDIIGIGIDSGIYHMAWNGATWSPWESRTGIAMRQPKVVSWGSGRLDIFVIGTDSALWHMSWNGFNWSAWESRGGTLIHEIDAVCWGPNRIDVFAIGVDNALWRMAWDGSNWAAWEGLGGVLLGSPKAVSWGINRLDVFGLGTDSALWHRGWDGSAWSDWETRGGTLVGF